MERAIVWDMDGVLVDTGEFHFRAWCRILGELGKDLSREEFLERFGMKSVDILRETLGDRSPEELRVLAARKEGYYREEIGGNVKPLPGVRTILESLQRAGFRQALASSAPRMNIDLILEAVGIRPFFDAVVSGDEVRAGKPDPEIFLEASRRIGVDPPACVVIEDAIPGVVAAKGAGMHCVAVTNSHAADDLSAADIIVDSLEHLSPGMLEKLLA